MSNEWLGDRERAIENEYFRRQDRELIAKLREEGRVERERQEIGDRLGSADDRLPAELQKIGFRADGLALLHLVPLIDVAWADKGVTGRERALVLALAERRGVHADSPEHDQLEAWLNSRPDQHVFDTAYEAIQLLLAHDTEGRRATTRQELVRMSTQVAEATGGILGMVPVSKGERECLDRISEMLTTKGDDPTDEPSQSSVPS
jgi:hypothetical protein